MAAPTLVTYLRSLEAVRDRSQQVFDLGKEGRLDHWDWHEEHFDTVVDYCLGILQRDFGQDYGKIPPHCRRNHFITPSRNRIANLLSHPSLQAATPLNRAATLIDLYLVSVLLDAGAGPDWTYTERENGETVWKGGRSEGLAVASYHLFVEGVFSSDKASPFQVDAKGLKALTPELLSTHLQVTKDNPMAGLEGRCNLLIQLGSALASRSDICANGRPGDMLKYLEKQISASPSPTTLPLSTFWATLFELLLPIWPSRTTLSSYPDQPLGDVWPCPSLDKALSVAGKGRSEGDNLVCFHKLTQWLCYSLVDAIESEAGWTIDRGSGQTGLPEYRNGGLMMDLGLLSLRPVSLSLTAYPNGRDRPPVLEPSHPAVVEWRALTVITLDKIHQRMCEKLNVGLETLSLAQVLEAATWKGGREIAKTKREGGGPPIDIISDGTVF